MNAKTLLLLSALLIPTAGFSDNVSVTPVDNGGGSSSGGGGGRTSVQPMRGGGHHGGGWRGHSSGGRGIRYSRIVPQADAGVPRQHTTIVRNTNVIRGITQQRAVEIVPNRYYWHSNGGVRYCHYYRGGVHWYGFYDGPRFYWTRYHGDRWWWFDAGFQRWLFWANGYWWYSGPGGVIYVYENDAYYAPNQAPVQVQAPQSAAVPNGAAVPEKMDGTWKSGDGQRMIQSFGPRAEAFLYDTSGGSPRYVAYLGQEVEKVRFSGGGEDVPLQILVDFKDGTFAIFSADGKKQTAAGASAPAPAAPSGTDTPSAPPSTPPIP